MKKSELLLKKQKTAPSDLRGLKRSEGLSQSFLTPM